MDTALAGGDDGGDPARGYAGGARLAELRAVETGGQGDPCRHRRVPRRQIDFGCRLGRGSRACHRPRTAGRIHHRHGQLDDVLPFVSQPAYTVSGGSGGLAARWSGLPGGAEIGIDAAAAAAYYGAIHPQSIASPCWRPVVTPSAKSSGVAGTLAIPIQPASSPIKAISVNVPPISSPT